MTDHLAPEVASDTAEGNPFPRSLGFLTQLDCKYGAEYTTTLLDALVFANRDDRARYMRGINTAIDIGSRACGDKSLALALAIEHGSSIIAAIHADTQSSGHHSVYVPESSPPCDRPEEE